MLCVLITVALAQPAPLTLSDVVGLAVEHNPDAIAVRASVEAQSSQTHVPRAQWYPTVGALLEILEATTNNSTATILGAAPVDLPRIGATPVGGNKSWQPQATTLAALGVRQEVFDFDRIRSQSRLADANLTAERARADAVLRDVVFNAAQAYYSVLGAEAVLTAATEAVKRAAERRAFIVAGVERGLRAAVDKDRAEADFERFDVARIRAAGALTNAKATLAAAIGADATNLEVAGNDASFDLGAIPHDAIATRAESSDPVLREARLRTEAQRRAVEAERSQAYPNLFFTGAVSGRNGGATSTSGPAEDNHGFLPDVPNWSVGLIFQVPIFDASVRARVETATARARALQASSEAVRLSVVTSAEATLRDYDVAITALPALERAQDAARRNSEQANARYREGLGTNLELAEAEALRVDAEIQLAVGKYNAARARLAVARAVSELSPANTSVWR